MFCLQILQNPVGIDSSIYSLMDKYSSLYLLYKFTRCWSTSADIHSPEFVCLQSLSIQLSEISWENMFNPDFFLTFQFFPPFFLDSLVVGIVYKDLHELLDLDQPIRNEDTRWLLISLKS